MMRTMLRNQVAFYYAPYLGKTEMRDEYGNLSGEYEIVYGNPVKVYGNISSAQGEMQTLQFGESETYDKVIVLGNPTTSIDEYSILWVDTKPTLSENGTLVLNADGGVETPHDYVVKKVARSLNSVSIAISKVNVRG